METEITRNNLLDINESLKYLAAKETSIWYQILKNRKKLKSHFDETLELRDAIIEKFAEKDENNNNLRDEKGNIIMKDIEKATEALKNLGLETIKIEFDKAKISDLCDSKIETRYIEPLLDIILTEE
jgi:hypothetical protein